MSTAASLGVAFAFSARHDCLFHCHDYKCLALAVGGRLYLEFGLAAQSPLCPAVSFFLLCRGENDRRELAACNVTPLPFPGVELVRHKRLLFVAGDPPSRQTHIKAIWEVPEIAITAVCVVLSSLVCGNRWAKTLNLPFNIGTTQLTKSRLKTRILNVLSDWGVRSKP
jgi:hypothetical protein